MNGAWNNQTFKWAEEIARINLEVLKDYKTAGHSWRCNAKKLEDASFGQSYSRSETEALFAFNQAPLPINVPTAILDTADAMMVSSKAEVYTAPIIFNGDDVKTQQSRNVASKFNQLLQNAWHSSLGNLQADRIVRDQGRAGHGIMFVRPESRYGEFNVNFDHLSWKYFFADPTSRDPLYRDMNNSIYAMPMGVKNAFKLIRGVEPNMSWEIFTKNFVEGSHVEPFDYESRRRGQPSGSATNQKAELNSQYVLFIRRATLEEETVYVAVPLKAGVNKRLSALDFRTFPEHTDLLKDMEKRGEIKIVPQKRFQLVEYLSVGNYGRKKVLAIQDHDIVGFPYDHRDDPYPNSRMTYIYPLQRALNKFMMSAVLNQSLMNNVRVMSEEGSITNMDKFTRSSSMPGAVIEYTLNSPNSKPPEVIRPEPMHEAWLSMPRYLTNMMEYVSGIFGHMMGQESNTPSTFSTIASLASAGGQKFKRRAAMFDATLSQAGRVAATYFKEYAPPNGYNVNFDPETRQDTTISFNTIKTAKKENGDYDIYTDPGEDLSLGFKDVRFTTRASTGYEASTEAMLLTQLSAQSADGGGLIPMILERLNIPGVDKYLKEQSQVNQLSRENKGLQEAVGELEKKTNLYQNQIFEGIKRLEAARYKGDFGKEMVAFKKDPLGYIESAMNNQGTR